MAEANGFNLHAGVRVAADDRDALERLCRYMARPAVASGRVSVLPDGNVAYRVKSPRSAGATHRVMTPMEFMARLAALVPPPRTPLVRYHGVVAPNSPWRVAVVPLPPREEGCPRVAAVPTTPELGQEKARTLGGEPPNDSVGRRDGESKRSARIEWARLLWRVWGVDALACPMVRRADENDRRAHRTGGDCSRTGAPRRLHRGAEDETLARRAVGGAVWRGEGRGAVDRHGQDEEGRGAPR